MIGQKCIACWIEQETSVGQGEKSFLSVINLKYRFSQHFEHYPYTVGRGTLRPTFITSDRTRASSSQELAVAYMTNNKKFNQTVMTPGYSKRNGQKSAIRIPVQSQ